MKYVKSITLGMLFLLSFYNMIYHLDQLDIINEDYVYIYQNQTAMEDLVEEAKGYGVYCRSWTLDENAEISAAAVNRSKVGMVSYAYDEAINIYTLGEEDSCVLSTELAKYLFGSTYAKEQQVQFNGKNYTVMGVVSEQKPILFLNGYSNSTDVNQAISMVMVNEIDKMSFGNINQVFHSSDEKIDIDLLKWMMQILLGMALTMVVLYVVLRMKRRVRWYFMLPVIIIWFGFFWLFLDQGYSLPIWSLPGKWSDFEGWVTLIDSLTGQLSYIARLSNLPVICDLFTGVFKSTLLIFITLGLFCIFHDVYKEINNRFYEIWLIIWSVLLYLYFGNPSLKAGLFILPCYILSKQIFDVACPYQTDQRDR